MPGSPPGVVRISAGQDAFSIPVFHDLALSASGNSSPDLCYFPPSSNHMELLGHLQMDFRTSLAIQWLRFRAEVKTEVGVGSIPSQGTKILHATQHSQDR